MTDYKRPLLCLRQGPASEDNHHINEVLRRAWSLGLISHTLSAAEFISKFYRGHTEAAEAAAKDYPSADERWNGSARIRLLESRLVEAETELQRHKDGVEQLQAKLDRLRAQAAADSRPA